MKIYIYPNAESRLEIIGCFTASELLINTLSNHFEVKLITTNETTPSDLTRFILESDPETYKKIDENTYVKNNTDDDEKIQINFTCSPPLAIFDKASITVSQKIAYIKVNTISEARKLIDMYMYIPDSSLPKSMLSEKQAIFSTHYFFSDKQKNSTSFLDFIEKITNEAGFFSTSAIAQFHVVIKNKEYNLSAAKKFENLLAASWSLWPKLLLISMTAFLVKKPYWAPVILPLLIIFYPWYLVTASVDYWLITRKINNILQHEFINRDELAYHFINGRSYDDLHILIFYVDAFEFADAVMHRVNEFKELCEYEYSGYLSLEIEIQAFTEARKYLLFVTGWAAWFKTVALGIVFPPSLYFTLPNYRDLLAHIQVENDFIDELCRFNADNSYGISFNGPENLYNMGNLLLNEQKPEYAVLFFAQVRPDQPFYEDAMVQCMHYYRAIEENEKALSFARFIDDKAFINSLNRCAPVVQHRPVDTELTLQERWNNLFSTKAGASSHRFFSRANTTKECGEPVLGQQATCAS